jgi:hypothetical protein
LGLAFFAFPDCFWVVFLRSVRDSEIKFLEAVGFGKDESEWITQYDSWSVREGFRSEYMIVGRDVVTNSECGKHRYYTRCGDVENHHGVFEGKDVWHNCVKSCGRPSCSRCWKYGWAVREANSINSRFVTAESVLGLPYVSVEHLQASVPKKDYGLSYDVLSAKAILALKGSGGFGGNIIFHGHRKDYVKRELFFSPHFHSLAYIRGGYKCRDCEYLKCSSKMRLYCAFKGVCDGFEQVTRRAHVDDGWIVSLAKNEKGLVEKRKSLFGTAWYQLEHASLKVGVVRFQIVKWWGVVNNRKLKTVRGLLEHRCSACNGFMERSFLPLGCEPIVSNRGEKGFVKNFVTAHVEDVEDEGDRSAHRPIDLKPNPNVGESRVEDENNRFKRRRFRD